MSKSTSNMLMTIKLSSNKADDDKISYIMWQKELSCIIHHIWQSNKRHRIHIWQWQKNANCHPKWIYDGASKTTFMTDTIRHHEVIHDKIGILGDISGLSLNPIFVVVHVCYFSWLISMIFVFVIVVFMIVASVILIYRMHVIAIGCFCQG
jgi:hypothetical protein